MQNRLKTNCFVWIVPVLLVITYMGWPVHAAEERGVIHVPVPGAGTPSAQRTRVALVFGNGAYPHSRLANPPNDARLIADVLVRCRFDVILKTDATLRDMEAAIADFGRKLTPNSVGFVFYAGHGIQSAGRNYLIPVDATLKRETDLKYETVDAGRILDEIGYAQNGLNIFILDACRNNPLTRRFRSAKRGLARLDNVPTGTLLAYSTAPGDVALDGSENNSPYSYHLARFMQQPGLLLEMVFKNVLKAVKDETHGRQIPWISSSISGDFYFIPPPGQPDSPDIIPAPGTTPSPPPSPPSTSLPKPPALPGFGIDENLQGVVLERHWLEENKPDFSFHEKVQLYAYKIGASRKGPYVKLQIETPGQILKNGMGIGRSVTYEFMRKQYRLTVLDIRPDAKRAQIRIHRIASAKDTAKAKDLINHWIEEIRPDFSFHDQVKLFAETIKAAKKGSYVKLEIETPSQSIKKTLKIGQSTTFDFMNNSYRLTLLDVHPDQRRARISIKRQ